MTILTWFAISGIIFMIAGSFFACGWAENSYFCEVYGKRYINPAKQPDIISIEQLDRNDGKRTWDEMVADGEGRKISGRWWREGEPEPKSDNQYYFGG